MHTLYEVLKDKKTYRFTQFDIIDFYPSISKTLLTNAIRFAKEYTEIGEADINVIPHARKTLLFANDSIWVNIYGIYIYWPNESEHRGFVPRTRFRYRCPRRESKLP